MLLLVAQWSIDECVMVSDPYIDVGVVWLPIIIVIVVTAAVLVFVVVPLLLFAAFKSSQRHDEKLIRRDTLRQSLQSRSARSRSLAAAAATTTTGSRDDVKRRRPPVSTTVLDITGVTLDESTVDHDKHKMMSADYAASSADTTPKKRPLTDASSYDDSDLGPVHRYGPPPTARRPLENEIATVGGRSLYGPAPAYPGLLNEGYLGDVYPGQAADSFDDRSIEARFAGVVDSSAGGGAGSSRATRPARPQLAAGATADRSSGGRRRRPPGDGAARDSPRVLTDSNGTATAASSSAASRTKRPRPKLNEYSM